MIIAALVVTPPAVAAGHAALLRPGVLATGAVIGLLSSVIPYRFELEALRRIPARVFGIWMSLEPAVAALIGLILLSESLAAREWAAVGLRRGRQRRRGPARGRASRRRRRPDGRGQPDPHRRRRADGRGSAGDGRGRAPARLARGSGGRGAGGSRRVTGSY